MIRQGNAGASSTATDTLPAHAEMTADASSGATDVGGPGVRLMRWLLGINLALVALQAFSAGLFLSGYAGAAALHRAVAQALGLGALIQAVTAVVLWRRHRVPGRVAGAGAVLFVVVVLELVLGFRRLYWLHVPIGVGLFGGLQRHMNRLETRSRATSAQS